MPIGCWAAFIALMLAYSYGVAFWMPRVMAEQSVSDNSTRNQRHGDQPDDAD